jgi:dihydrofolate synthase/folylpolyglutamate synthase
MHAQRLGVPLACIGREFDHAADGETWSWRYRGQRRSALPLPVLRGEAQLQNAAGVLMVLEWLKDELPVSQNELREGLLSVNLPGRFQVLPGQPQRILDVAHNPHAARALAGVLQRIPRRGRIHAVLAMRSDKDIDGVVAALSETIDVWHVASLDVDQGATCLQLAESVSKTCPTVPVHQYEGPPEAYSHACARAAPTDMIVVLGSFYTVSAVLGLAETRAGDPVYQV